MLCKTCWKRPSCKKPCGKLKRHLRGLTNYQREDPLELVILEDIFGRAEGLDSAQRWDLVLEHLDPWKLIADLPQPAQTAIVGHIWQGQSLLALSRKLKVSPGRARRIFRAGLEKLRERILAQTATREIMLSTCSKSGYNKNSRHGKKQRQKNTPKKNQGPAGIVQSHASPRKNSDRA